MSRSKHWSTTVFVRHAPVYAEILEAIAPRATAQVEGLVKILERAGIHPDGRVLDIACGIGRHAIPLASAGYQVVGCDLSPGLLQRARRRARLAHLPRSRIGFYQADYRAIGAELRRAGEPPFDAAVSIFTSMGYRGARSDRNVLRGLRRLVRPGGLFVLELADRDAVLRRFRPVDVVRWTPTLEQHERREFDRETSTMHSTWTFFRPSRRGHLRRVFETEITVRLYSLHELRDLMREAGWKYETAYGDLATLEPVSFESQRLVVVASNPPHRGAG